MAYSSGQISDILLKADKTVYKIGDVAYENMFSELDEAYDYERDIIFIYKKAVEYGDNYFVGTLKLDQIVERLAAKLNIYDYGTLAPIYVDVYTQVNQGLNIIYVLKTTALNLGSGLTGSTDFSQSQVDINIDYSYLNNVYVIDDRTLTLNGVTYDLSSNRSWSISLDSVTDVDAVTTNKITVGGVYLTGMTAGSGALYYTGSRLTLANYNAGGTVYIEVNGGSYAAVFGTDLSFTSYGTIGGVFNNATVDTDKFIVSDGGVLKYRTGAQLLSDIGAQPSGSYVPTTRTLTINGTAYDLSSDRSWSVGNITGSGTANQVAFFNSSDNITSESNLYWDATNNKLGIENSNPNALNAGASNLVIGDGTAANRGLTIYTGSTNDGNIFFANPSSTYAGYIQYSHALGRFTFGLTGGGSMQYGTSTGLYLHNIPAATVDTDKFLVSDNGYIKYRTGTQLLSDIGAQGTLTLTTTGTSGPATLIANTLNIPNYGSVLTGYVPYTGATGNVDLGYNTLSAGFLNIIGNSAGATGYIGFRQDLSVTYAGINYTSITAEDKSYLAMNFAQTGSDYKLARFSVAGLTNNIQRTYSFPNASGTLALTSDIPVVTGYVPYTGATQDLDLGTYGLIGDFVRFNPSSSNIPSAEGVMSWDSSDGTVSLSLKGNSYSLPIGQSLVARVVNNTGAQLNRTDYRVVRVSSAQGQRLAVSLAQANNDANSADTIGVVCENISNNQEGFIINVGHISEINTTGSLQGETWADGDSLYLSATTPGVITNIKPIAPNHGVRIGYVEYAHSQHGKIYVKIDNGYELDELHDVEPTPYVNKGVLYRDTALNLWKSATIQTLLGYTPANQATTLTINGTTYDLSANRTWSVGTITSLTGEATASGTGAVSVTLSNSAVIGKVLTGLNLSGGGTIVSTDSILQAFGKVQNQISALVGGVMYKGVWDANVNSPSLTSSVGNKGDYYIVNVAGSTNLNGITDWRIGDWAIFNGSTWDKVDNTDAVSSVNTFTGAVSLTTANIPEVTNLYYTDARSRSALSFAAGSGNYSTSTGVITIPTNTNQLTNGANFITLASISASSPLIYSSGALSIQVANSVQNGYISSTDWNKFNNNIPAGVPSTGDYVFYNGSNLAYRGFIATSPLSYNSSTGTYSISQATTSTDGYLSSADWNTFNNKQSALTNPVTGTGTTNYVPKFTGTSTIGNSVIYDNGGSIGINITDSSFPLEVSSNAGGSSIKIRGRATANTGTLRFYSNDNGTQLAKFEANDSSVELGAITNVPLVFYQNATERMRLTSTGLGIGSSSPIEKLHVAGNIYTNGTNTNIYLDNGGAGGATLKIGVTGTTETYINSLDNDPIWFGINSTERMRLTSTGLGIGTSSPAVKLDVNGSGRFNGFDATYYNENILAIGNATYNPKIGLASTSGYRWNARIKDVGGNGEYVIRYEEGSLDALMINRLGNLGLGVTPSASSWVSFELLGGNVITSYPSATIPALYSASNAYYNSGWIYKNSANALLYAINANSGQHQWFTAPSGTAGNAISFTQAMTLDASGRLGLGTTSPGTLLDVRGEVSIAYNATYGLRFYNDARNNWSSIGNTISGNSDANLVFKTANGTALTLAGTGAATFSSSVTAGSFLLTKGSITNDTGYGTGFNVIGSATTYIGSSTGIVGFIASNGEVMRLTSTGLGIGTTSPTAKFGVKLATATAASTIANTTGWDNTYAVFGNPESGTAQGYAIGVTNTLNGINLISVNPMSDWVDTNYYSRNHIFYGGGTERLRISSGGDILIGETSDGYTTSNRKVLGINGTNEALISFRASGTAMGYIFAYSSALDISSIGRDFTVSTGVSSPTERMRVTTGGEVYIAGTTDQGAYNLQVNGTGVWGAGAYVNGSDVRLKENIKDITSAIDLVNKLKPKTFNYKESYSKDRNIQTGFIAQDLQETFANEEYLNGLVQQGPEHLNVAYQNLIPLLTKAIQELKAEIDILKNK